jgi:hypothetical protein
VRARGESCLATARVVVACFERVGVGTCTYQQALSDRRTDAICLADGGIQRDIACDGRVLGCVDETDASLQVSARAAIRRPDLERFIDREQQSSAGVAQRRPIASERSLTQCWKMALDLIGCDDSCCRNPSAQSSIEPIERSVVEFGCCDSARYR